ncbi:adenomatous polyposis coli, partial [Elysia marginata]
ASDQTKLYCEEGTPTCFSRVSSLSSLHSSEARENAETHVMKHLGAGNDKADLPCIVESDMQEAMLDPSRDKKREVYPGASVEAESGLGAAASAAAGKAGNGPGSNLRRVAEPGQRSDREAKTVTFDENHQVKLTVK